MKSGFGKIITLTGAIVAFSIGAGFATGQEVLQFFSSYGLMKCLGAALITLVLYIWVCSTVMQDARELQPKQANDIWVYYCGKYFGNFMKWFTPIFLFAVLVVMTSGAGATINQYYGLPNTVGRLLITVLMLVTVILGKDKLTKILGGVGIVIIVFALLVGIVSLCQNAGNLGTANETLATMDVAKAAPFWWLSGILYTTFMAINLVPFLSGIAPDCESKSEARLGGIGGGVAFVICLIIMALAILASIGTTGTAQVPTLVIADAISPVFGVLFSIILILGIYSTTVSLLWICCNFISADEKSTTFRLSAVIGSVIVYFGSLLPFGTLVGIIYPYTGYLGIVIFVCVAVKHFAKKSA